MVRNLADLGADLQKVMKHLLLNQNLLKLLYYTDKDPLSHPDLDKCKIQNEIFEKLVKITPRISPRDIEDSRSIVALRIIKGTETSNKQFRDIVFSIESFVPLTQWLVKDENLRPFLIMGEVERSLKGKRINGLGKIEGGDFELDLLTEEVSSYEQIFRITSYD